MKKIISLFVLTFILTGCFDKELKDPNLTIKSELGSYELKLEHATTPEQLMNGLQHRTKLAKQHGMLFEIRPIRNIQMWMKDTLIPLDMIFVGYNNKVVKVVENTTPNSEETISSSVPVRAVIEVNAGEAKKFGVKMNDDITSELLPAIRCNKMKKCDNCAKDKKCECAEGKKCECAEGEKCEGCKDKAKCGCDKKTDEVKNESETQKVTEHNHGDTNHTH